ncbi:hypothetical protein BD289DRAFT_216240 [Coniella lustricola]|uniref:Uncharacterized protein n=1 Tax=Coniella lustricola TaxID=2025994 RepID=A0A2T3AB68_9PEZI|nr:hypothetical protein BD289DRAFT_216240 [Coniella lustricola]
MRVWTLFCRCSGSSVIAEARASRVESGRAPWAWCMIMARSRGFRARRRLGINGRASGCLNITKVTRLWIEWGQWLLMAYVGHYCATDQTDRIYALLGVRTEKEREVVGRANYHLRVEKVYTRLAERFIQVKQCLDIACVANKERILRPQCSRAPNFHFQLSGSVPSQLQYDTQYCYDRHCGPNIDLIKHIVVFLTDRLLRIIARENSPGCVMRCRLWMTIMSPQYL